MASTLATPDLETAQPPAERYRIVRELARGGMAVVYLARQESLERDVALKLLLPFGSRSADMKRFLFESRVAGGLNHPAIVQVLDCFEQQGCPCIAMEYVAGGSLREHQHTRREGREGAIVLADVAPRFPPETIHLAVVDPGVGTSRRMLYAEIGQQRYLAPDNGLLSFLMKREPPRRAALTALTKLRHQIVARL